MPAFFCGEALCKRPVGAPDAAHGWLVRCDACGTALYPADVLARIPPNELEPKRGELMTERNGVRVSFEAGAAKVEPAASDDADLSKLLEMVDLDPKATAAAAKARTRVIAVVAIVAVLALIAFLATRS